MKYMCVKMYVEESFWSLYKTEVSKEPCKERREIARNA